MRRNRERVNKRKTRQAFFNSRLHQPNPSSGRSGYIPVPLTTVFLLCKNTRSVCKVTTRHPCRALHEAKFPAQLATSAEREVPRAGFFRVSYHKARRKRRALCPHKESQSAFIPFITSERMRSVNCKLSCRSETYNNFN